MKAIEKRTNSEVKASRIPPKPESLEAKFKLLELLPYHPLARRKHCLVYGFIVDWFHADYGDALASVRHVVDEMERRRHRLPDGIGLGQTQTHQTLRDLVAWNFLTELKGTGRWASRFVPNWSLVCSPPASNDNCVPPPGDAISVPPVGNASVPPVGNANGLLVPPPGDEDPSTRTRLQDRGTGVDGGIKSPTPLPAAPAAPAFAGGRAAGAVFEELWATYGLAQNKSAARAAYIALAPVPSLHTAILEAATRWRQAWEAQNDPDAPRKQLGVWLREECFECDPPKGFKARKRSKVTTKADDTAHTSAPKSDEAAGLTEPPAVMRIAGSSIRRDKDGKYLEIRLVNLGDDGESHRDEFCLEHDDWQAQDWGRRRLKQLLTAANLSSIDDTDALEGAIVTRTLADGRVDYLPPAAAAA